MRHHAPSKLGLLFLLLASTLTILAGAALAPALPDMRTAFAHIEHAPLWVKIILTLPGLVIALCAPFVGPYLDTHNKYKCLLIALLLYGLTGAAGFIFNDSLWALVLSRIGLGVCVAFIMISTTTLAGEYFKGPAFGNFMGLQAAFSSFGGVLFLGLSGLLADISWSATFLIYLFAWAVLLGLLLCLTPPSAPVTKALVDTRPLHSKHISLCYVLGFVEVFMLYMVVIHFPFYIEAFRASNPSEVGLAMAGMMAVLATTAMNYKHISRLGNFATLHSIAFLCSGAGMCLLGLAQHSITVLFGLTLLGLGLGMMRPNLIVWLFSMTSLAHRGKIMGRATTYFFLASFAAPLVTQPIIERVGFGHTFVAFGVMSLVMCPAIFIYFNVKHTQPIAQTPLKRTLNRDTL